MVVNQQYLLNYDNAQYLNAVETHKTLNYATAVYIALLISLILLQCWSGPCRTRRDLKTLVRVDGNIQFILAFNKKRAYFNTLMIIFMVKERHSEHVYKTHEIH